MDNLGSKFKFESAIGLNGKIWIKASSVQGTIYIVNALRLVEQLNEEQLKQHSNDVLETFTMVKG